MSTVSLMTSLLTEDCSSFCRRNTKRSVADCLKMCLVRQDPLMTQNASVVDLEDQRHAADCRNYSG